MKNFVTSVLSAGTILLLSSCATQNAAQTAGQMDVSPWPLIFSDTSGSYTVYEPQCDSWDGHQFTGRSAVSIRPSGQAQPTYGVLQFSAITLVNKSTRTVSLAGVKVTGTDFPSGNGPMESYLATLRNVFSKRAPSLSLDNLENNLAVIQPQKPERVLNTPPKVIVAYRPAVLVSIDGPPAWRSVPDTGLERVINTRVLLLKDKSGRCYLHVFDGYLQADSLDGHWTVAAQPPDGAAAAEKQAVDAGQVDLMKGTPDAVTHAEPSLHTSAIPDVYVATAPSELITFSGQPEYAAIPGTDLLYADNTTGDVFKLLTDQQTYILISGRWYRASSLNGPWEFVPGNELPHDFADIPDTSPKENVKASVAGTPQAEEALIANSIPQSDAVPRTDQMQAPQLDGAMQLAPIEGTPLHYVVNSGTPIIEVDPQSWYACQNGVWYAGTSADGPWTVAASVPAVIYTIPDTSPLHYLTYVQVYGSTPQVVYEGYTPGYLGTVVAGDGTVVYGTGYDYTPWIGGVWISPPVTWGCGFDDCWTPWWGWGFNCGFGWGCEFAGVGWSGCAPPFPWWGGYCGWHDFDGDGWGDGYRGDFANTSGDFFHQGNRLGQFGRDGWRNQFAAGALGGDPHGWKTSAGEFGHAYNSRTGQLAGGQSARVQRVYGSAWNPARRSFWPQNNGLVASYKPQAMGARGFANNPNGLVASYKPPAMGARGFANNPGWDAGRFPISPNYSRSFPAPAGRGNFAGGFGSVPRTYGGSSAPLYSPRAGGFARSFPNDSPGGRRGGGGFSASPRGGGWSRGTGAVFHGGGGGGGGYHGGGGGGHGGGGFSGGGGGFHGGGGGGGGGHGGGGHGGR